LIGLWLLVGNTPDRDKLRLRAVSEMNNGGIPRFSHAAWVFTAPEPATEASGPVKPAAREGGRDTTGPAGFQLDGIRAVSYRIGRSTRILCCKPTAANPQKT